MAYAGIVYHPHARLRMRQRRISERQVVATVSMPDRRSLGHSGRIVAERTTEVGNTIRVIYEEIDGGTTAYVWTVMRRGGTPR